MYSRYSHIPYVFLDVFPSLSMPDKGVFVRLWPRRASELNSRCMHAPRYTAAYKTGRSRVSTFQVSSLPSPPFLSSPSGSKIPSLSNGNCCWVDQKGLGMQSESYQWSSSAPGTYTITAFRPADRCMLKSFSRHVASPFLRLKIEL